MVEEITSLEGNLYKSCERMEQLYKEYLYNIDNEKISFIGKKINKIKRYINTSELVFELSTDKEQIQNNITSIIESEEAIGQYIEDPDINEQEIRRRVDLIVDTIKNTESAVNLFFDISPYLNRDGIKNGIEKYKRELNVINKSIVEMENETNLKFINLKKEGENSFLELEDKHEEFKNSINNQVVEFTKKITEMENTIEEKNNEIQNTKEEYNKTLNELQESYSNKITEFENNAIQDFDSIKEEIEKKNEQISKLIGLIGDKVNVGEYKTNADEAHSERIKWQKATIAIFVVAFVLMVLITFFTKDYNITTLARYVVSVILIGASGYTGKQASNLRKDEVYYRKQQLELLSIDVYLDNLPDETKIQIKQELSNKIFGQARETYKSKYDDNTNATLDKAIKIIEDISSAMTKK